MTGACVLKRVKVQGNVTIQSGGGLELDSSTVVGDLAVRPGGELDSGASLDTGASNGMPSKVQGNLTLSSPLDMDFYGGSIGGSVSFTGNTRSTPRVCGAAVGGDVRLINFTPRVVNIGDSDGDSNGPCAGNMINGSVFVTNSNPVEVDGNRISGDVQISNSWVGYDHNSLQGNLTCTNNGRVFDFNDNTINGFNNCGMSW